MANQDTRSHKSARAGATPHPHQWSPVTNHTLVLACIAVAPHEPLRVVAEKLGITERAVQKIVLDLEHAHILTRSRSGRNNRYEIDVHISIAVPGFGMVTTGELIALLVKASEKDVLAISPSKPNTTHYQRLTISIK